MRALRLLVLASALVMSHAATAVEPVRVYAAGSLRAVLTELGAQYKAGTGIEVQLTFGASGLLKDRIGKGEAADLFASANTDHPAALAKAGLAAPVRVFTRNELCALVSAKAPATTDTVLKTMLDPVVKLGISTPKADPSGDYALQVFDKAAAVAGKPAADTLRAKALTLTGGPNSPPPAANRSQYGELVANGQADIFLTYCTNAVIALKEQPALKMVTLPANLSVGADYGMVVMKRAGEQASAFAAFLVSPVAQAVFARHGFGAIDGGR
ncbi:MAG: molybdate ABC transporter substrate-binding protein [Burkholderiales bacterium]|nr:molybdate ABC transporter substrate-binding protein [Burkholderiales bacterium]